MWKLSLILICALSASCEKKSSSTSERGAAASDGFPEQIALTGSLNLDPETSSAIASGDPVAGRLVQLVDDNGEVIGETRTQPSGVFSLEISTAQMGLTQASEGLAAIPRMARLKSIFLTEEASGDAVGLRTPIIISPNELTPGADGKPTIRTGSHTARKVGAIVGKVSLETNEDPTGIDIYIPGTTHIAKTDATGTFLLGFLPPGTFNLRADRNGFNAVDWNDVIVSEKATTRLTPVTLEIAKGPKIVAFTLTDFLTESGIASVKIQLSGASKYRLSTTQDFSNAVFNPVNAGKSEISTTFPVNSGARVVTIYLEAVDSGGLTAKQSITIDREAPYLGKISINDADGIINTVTVPLTLSAQGATKMRFSETKAGLASAPYVPYAVSANFAINTSSDGEKIVYVQYSDDADNSIGNHGDLFAMFTLDRTPPLSKRIELLAPASPTGAFNAPLSWLANYPDVVSYEVEIFNNPNYTGTPIRTMTTADTVVKTTPSLTVQGIYYWRVRAIDIAGNASDWVVSGETRRFELKVLREAYQPKSENKGEAGKELYHGRAMVAVGDLSGDGVSEIAVSTMSADTATCTGCGIVEVINPVTKAVLATLTENLSRNAAYGSSMVLCDLDGDNKDELVVSAPQSIFMRNGYTYHSVGGVYAYNLTNYSKMASYQAGPGGDSDPAPGYWCWNDWDPATNTSFQRCGSDFSPEAIDSGWANGGASRNFGKALACERTASGAENLFVSEPGYMDGTGMTTGKVHELSRSGTTFAPVADAVPVSSWTNFGNSMAFVSSFNWSGGACVEGPTLAVGAPERGSAAAPTGAVHLLQKVGAGWTECGRIEAEPTDTWEFGRFGFRVFNIGDLVDADGVEELAVSTGGWMGGQVRIFGGIGGG
jgi:hypothetical protein